MKYLAFDLGRTHTGVAISYEGQISSPLATLNSSSLAELERQIIHLIDSENPNVIIIGQPATGPFFTIAETIHQQLKSHLPHLECHLHPEDLTSEIAKKKLFESQAKKSRRQTITHAAAAAIILDDFLENLSST
jgi:putative transcription antitermination factor YqgF